MEQRAIIISMNYFLIEDALCALLRFIDMLPTVYGSLKLFSSRSSASQASISTIHTAEVFLKPLLNWILLLAHLEH